MFQDIEAAASRKVYVQKHAVIAVHAELLHGRIEIHGISDNIALLLQRLGHELLKRKFIFDYKQFHSLFRQSLWTSPQI